MDESHPNEETRRRFEQLLEAKKKAGHDAGSSGPTRREQRSRAEPAKGGRGFTRRKV